ncbi:site-specific integrase [Burkholderia sp. JPY481]
MSSGARCFAFSDRKIASLRAPPADRVTYRDSEIRGLELRVSASGVKSFSVLKRTRAGRLERLGLGRFPVVDTKRARHEAATLLAEISAGANPAEARRALRAEPTLDGLFATFLDDHAKPFKKSWEEDEAQYRRYLAAPLGARRASEITDDVLRAWHRRISKTAPAAANQALALVSTVFAKAIEWKLISGENPAKRVKKNPRVERDRFLSGAELKRFFVAIDGEANPDYRDAFQLALLTGARRGSVLAMQWRDVDLGRGEWRLPTTKNGDSLVLPLVPAAVEILAARERSRGFVFPSEASESGHLATVARAWRRLLDRDELAEISARLAEADEAFDSAAGALAVRLRHARAHAERLGIDVADARLPDLRPHDLRRTGASWQAQLGTSLAIIGRGLGHRSQRSTAIYARLQLDPVRASVERATDAMLAQRESEGAEVVPLGRAG